MGLLLDLFGYLSVVLHGLTIAAQSMALGGMLFLLFLARPFEPGLDAIGKLICDRTERIVRLAALGLVLCEAGTIWLQGVVLVGTVEIGWLDVLQAEFAVAGMVKMAGGLLIALTLDRHRPAMLPVAGCVIVLAAAVFTSHANARLDHRVPLLLIEALHQFGAAIWIGGIPCFVMSLNRCTDGIQWRRVGKRFSQMSMVGVACIIASGLAMAWSYVGSLAGFYGTAYGVMVSAKIVMLCMLLALGAGNYLVVERLRRDPSTSILRLKRFAEAEIGIGFTLFFAAASLTSSPPAIDLVDDRASWAEIVERNWPQLPRLTSPTRGDLAIPALQAKLDAEAAAAAKQPPQAVIPGSGDPLPRNAEDIAWSEYNHHWAGVFVLVIGLLALANQAGARWARHWPLMFLALGGFMLVRSDPESWPLGPVGFWEGLRDPEVLQHRALALLVILFALFEWRVRAGSLQHTKAALVFPLVTAVAAGALLTHQHSIANVKELLLIEITHTPLALAGVTAAWARWLELRLEPPLSTRFGWVWPICLVLVGVILLDYREA